LKVFSARPNLSAKSAIAISWFCARWRQFATSAQPRRRLPQLPRANTTCNKVLLPRRRACSMHPRFRSKVSAQKGGTTGASRRSAGREGPLMVSTCHSFLETHPRGQPHEAQHG
jgi:hypothetical protein